MVAAAISEYDNTQEDIEDESYGKLKAYYKSWGLSEVEHDVLLDELPMKTCTRA